MVIRLCLQPLAALLQAHIERSGQVWEEKQMATEVERASGEEAAPRKTRLQEYADLTAEQEFLAQVRRVLRGPGWSHLPTAAWTLTMQSLVFRMTAQMECMVWELLVTPARRLPVLLWKDLGSPSRVAANKQIPACMRDPFSQAFFEKYPDADTDPTEARSVLDVLALAAFTGTLGIEWSHGRVSRLVKQQQVQTQTPTLSHLNSQLLCQRHWQRSLEARCAVGLGLRRSGTQGGKRALSARQAAGKGGKEGAARIKHSSELELWRSTPLHPCPSSPLLGNERQFLRKTRDQ